MSSTLNLCLLMTRLNIFDDYYRPRQVTNDDVQSAHQNQSFV